MAKKWSPTWLEVLVMIVIILAIAGTVTGFFKWGGVYEIDSVTPVELVDVDVDNSSVEKESKFLLDVLVNHGSDVEILGFEVNALAYTTFVKSQTEEGLYVIEITATDLIGTQIYKLGKILYKVDSEDKTVSIVESEGITSSVNMTQTHNQPLFVGVSVPATVSAGTAVVITMEFDDVEGITELVLNGTTYDEETDFDVVDNTGTITLSLAGLSVGEKEYVLESYTFDTGTQSVRVDLTANNTMEFSIVKAEPQLESLSVGSGVFTVAEVNSGIATYDLVISMDDVADLYSVTVDGIKYILSTHNDVTVNLTLDTVTIALEQTNTTIGTYTAEFEKFQYFDSLAMKEVVLTESNTYSINVTA